MAKRSLTVVLNQITYMYAFVSSALAFTLALRSWFALNLHLYGLHWQKFRNSRHKFNTGNKTKRLKTSNGPNLHIHYRIEA